MSEPASLVNIGKLSEPATVLVNRISDAVGGIFKPMQVRRIAKAEADAEVIRAKADIEVSELQRRAFYRFLDEEAKKQTNMENITQKALPSLSTDAKPEEVESDWLTHFFDRARLVSDEDMQLLWSKVLAGEASKCGSYSKRTVNLLSSLDKSDAEAFKSFCTFCVGVGFLWPVVFDTNHEVYTRHGVSFAGLLHLESVGLIQFDHLAGFSIKRATRKVHVEYYGTHLDLTMPKERENDLSMGHTLLTQAGSQLAPICGAEPDPAFLEYLRERWRGYLDVVPTPPAKE